jgi:hypothetical protein
MSPDESNDLAWLTLARAEELMDAAESTRVIRKLGALRG